MKLQLVKNIVDRSSDAYAEMRLLSHVGGENGISGQRFADELAWLQEYRAVGEVLVRLNCPGGIVLDTYSIFNSIVSANASGKCDVHTQNVGVAASCGGWILQAGKRREMVDYGIFMMHDPTGKLSDIDMELVNLMKASIVRIFANNTPITPEVLDEMMSQTTWLDASQSLEKGFVDKIITSVRKPSLVKAKNSVSNLFSIYNTFLTKDEPMLEEIKRLLGLKNEASDSEVEAKLKEYLAAKEAEKTLQTQVSNLENEVKDLKAEKAQAQVDKEAQQKLAATELVENAIKLGKLKEDVKESWVKMATTDFVTVKNSLESLGAVTKAASITNTITNQTGTGTKAGREAWSIRDWEKKDAVGLAKIKNETPEVYDQMYNAFYKKQ